MTVSQYDHVVPYTDLGGRGYFGVNAAHVCHAYIAKYLQGLLPIQSQTIV